MRNQRNPKCIKTFKNLVLFVKLIFYIILLNLFIERIKELSLLETLHLWGKILPFNFYSYSAILITKSPKFSIQSIKDHPPVKETLSVFRVSGILVGNFILTCSDDEHPTLDPWRFPVSPLNGEGEMGFWGGISRLTRKWRVAEDEDAEVAKTKGRARNYRLSSWWLMRDLS